MFYPHSFLISVSCDSNATVQFRNLICTDYTILLNEEFEVDLGRFFALRKSDQSPMRSICKCIGLQCSRVLGVWDYRVSYCSGPVIRAVLSNTFSWERNNNLLAENINGNNGKTSAQILSNRVRKTVTKNHGNVKMSRNQDLQQSYNQTLNIYEVRSNVSKRIVTILEIKSKAE